MSRLLGKDRRVHTPSKVLVSFTAVAFALSTASCGDDATSRAAVQTTAPDTASAVPDAPAGSEFVDPQGTYTITIGPDWVQLPGMVVQEVEAWSVAEPADGFGTNVNVLTQDSLGRDLEGYIELSLANMGTYQLVASSMIVGTNGNPLALLEYRSVPAEGSQDLPLHFLATIDVRDGVAVVATLASLEAEFEAHRVEVEAFLQTLQAS